MNNLNDSVAFQVFMEKIVDKAGEWEQVLRSESDTVKMHRAQGALEFADFVKSLPDLIAAEATLVSELDKADYLV